MKRIYSLTMAILSVSVLVSACATYPRSGEDQAAYHANEARAAIAKDECWRAVFQIEVALSLPTGDAKIRELFVSSQKNRDCYYGYLEKAIADIWNVSQAAVTFRKLSVANSAALFSENQARDLFARLTRKVTEGNLSGSVPFDLADEIDLFPELKSPSHQQIIINRSIKNLQGAGSAKRPVGPLMDYVQRVGAESTEGKRVESLLPTMNIRRDELEAVAKVFPKFATARKEEITARVYLQVKNGDRLFTDDLLQVLRSGVRGVEWVPSSGPKTITLVIERVRNDERTLPERSQTITYAQHEVNLFEAVLLMPRNASYLYEVVSGGAEIEYGYVVSAVTDGKMVHDEVIRGKVRGEYRRCQNARIQNVFGGVSSAGFVANNDMQQRCSGPSSASVEELRRDVFSKILEGVLKVPAIKVVHELN